VRDHNSDKLEKVNTRIIAIANQKGGVGKTTTAINLATAMAAAHNKVLIIDFDPQGNASTGFGISKDKRTITAYEVMIGQATLEEAIIQTEIPGLSLVTSSVDLLGAEIELIKEPRREHRLADVISRVSGFDFILIDCPPSLSLLTLNALVAAQKVLVPLQCEFFALEGLSHLVKTIEKVKKAYNPILELNGIVLTMYDRRNNLSDDVAADVRGYFGEIVYKTVIPRNIRISEAPSHGKPVLLYDTKCTGSEAYIHLAGEVLKRERGMVA
jgi:chromosome partitioning protein